MGIALYTSRVVLNTLDPLNFPNGKLLLYCLFQIGTVFAPFIVDLGGENNHGLPPAIFGAMMILSSSSLLFTPETKGLPLIQNYKDMALYSFTQTSIIGKLYHKLFKNK